MRRRPILVGLLAAAVCAADPAPQAELTITAGNAFSYRPAFAGQVLTYLGEKLPPGLTVDPRTGMLSGRPTTAGVYDASIIARGAASQARLRFRMTVEPAATAPPPAAGPAAGPPPAYDAGGGEEEDQADPMLAAGSAKLHDWTDNQRRVIHGWFLPAAATLPDGDWYYRISHVARKGYDEEARTNLLGLDDDVKLGFMLAWAPAKAVTLSLQRVNGRDLAVPPHDNKAVQYDTWDTLVQVQILDQRGVRGLRPGPCDLALVAGTSWMLRNHGTGDSSIDLGVVAERDLFDDRLRLGVGLWHAGLSAYDAAVGGIGPQDKRFPDETGAASENSTSAVGLSLRFAISQHWFLLGEAIQPIRGWETGHGPSLAAGFAFDTNTHEFAVYFSNTANAAFNGVLTGGAQEMALPFFAFSISAYL